MPFGYEEKIWVLAKSLNSATRKCISSVSSAQSFSLLARGTSTYIGGSFEFTAEENFPFPSSAPVKVWKVPSYVLRPHDSTRYEDRPNLHCRKEIQSAL